MDETLAPETVAARTVLLDAIEALAGHQPALIVVGAQAIYLRTGLAGLRVAPYTTDGDLALDPTLLGDDPLLEEAMARGGFRLRRQGDGGVDPGTWIGTTEIAGETYSVQVDLIVPAAVLEGGRTRGARLPIHGKRAAKRTYGLEAALVDQGKMKIQGLAVGDDREFEMAVGGVGALLVSKVHKLRDRLADGRQHRIKDKDAGDVLRLMRAIPVAQMAERLGHLLGHPVAAAVTEEAANELMRLFRAPRSLGTVLAADSVEFDLPRAQVEALMPAYVRELERRLEIRKG